MGKNNVLFACDIGFSSGEKRRKTKKKKDETREVTLQQAYGDAGSW